MLDFSFNYRKDLEKMRKTSKIILVLGVIMLMSVSAFAAFSDMPAGNDGEVLQKAVDNGLINGFEDGTIQPGTPITRAQMAAIMSRAMNAEEVADISAFADVKPEDWFYTDMAKAVQMDAFKGDTNSCLNPNNTITRQEAFIVLCRIFDVPDSDKNALSQFEDASQVASWAKVETRSIAAAGYLGDITQLRPLAPMTRLEFAQIMDKIVAAYIDEDGEYTTLPEGNVLVRAQNVSFKGVTTDDVIFIGDGVKEIVNFTDCVCERIVIRGKKTAINSGTYTWIRGIGRGTEVYLMKNPLELVKVFEDGTTGKFYAAPGKAVLIPLVVQTELKEK